MFPSAVHPNWSASCKRENGLKPESDESMDFHPMLRNERQTSREVNLIAVCDSKLFTRAQARKRF
jgi:hypothetical protein